MQSICECEDRTPQFSVNLKSKFVPNKQDIRHDPFMTISIHFTGFVSRDSEIKRQHLCKVSIKASALNIRLISLGSGSAEAQMRPASDTLGVLFLLGECEV